MVKKKRYKLKGPVALFCKIFIFIVVVFVGILIFYLVNLNSLMDLSYSEDASREILFEFKKDYVMKIGENKTLNAAFESKDRIESNYDFYSDIEYQDQENIIKNINELLKKGYNTDDISTILAHGSDSEVTEFAKREKIKYLDEFYQYDFANISLYDRYVAYTEETGEDNEIAILHVNLNLDKVMYDDAVLVDEFSELMLVNKYNFLGEDFIPDDLIKFDEDYASSDDIRANEAVVDAFSKMADEALLEGYNLIVNSGYRSYQEQLDIIDTYYNLYGQSYIDNYVAKAGFSEHQTGLGIDVGSRDTKIFAESDEYKWMVDNAHKYGFILRFPEWGEEITLFNNEPWHYRYVGVPAATYIYENDMTFEEYYVKVLNK